MEKKISYTSALENAINGNLTAEVIDRLCDLKASLEKRSSKPTKSNIETEKTVEVIREVLAGGFVGTVSEMQKSDIRLADVSTSRVTSALTSLKKGGFAKNEMVKGKSIYSLA